jgi:uncharacterized protein (DUF697 family)
MKIAKWAQIAGMKIAEAAKISEKAIKETVERNRPGAEDFLRKTRDAVGENMTRFRHSAAKMKQKIAWGIKNAGPFVEEKKKSLESGLKGVISNKDLSPPQKADIIIHSTGLTCGVLALVPLPFADFFILTPIQIVMVQNIGKAYGFEMSQKEAQEALLEVAGVVGMAWLGQQTVLTLYKTVIPYAGGLFTVPLVWSVCYGMGSVAKYYFHVKSKDQVFDPAVAKQEYRKGKEIGGNLGKKENEHIAHIRADIKEYLGDYYLNCPEAVKNFILSAEQDYFNQCVKKNTIVEDYKGIASFYTVAVESLLNDIFMRPFRRECDKLGFLQPDLKESSANSILRECFTKRKDITLGQMFMVRDAFVFGSSVEGYVAIFNEVINRNPKLLAIISDNGFWSDYKDMHACIGGKKRHSSQVTEKDINRARDLLVARYGRGDGIIYMLVAVLEKEM